MEITGKELKSKIENGEQVIVDFWATFCGPCKMYKPTFEGESCDPDEKDFQEVMDGILERLDIITAKSKVIDKVKPDEDSVLMG